MNKILLLFMCLIIPLSVFAETDKILVANIEYEWINKNELEKECIIEEIRSKIFSEPILKNKDLKFIFKDKLKDKNHWENYIAASEGKKEYRENNISAFYYKKMKHIYMYALQDKKDITNSFYYDAMGNLQYIDFNKGDYPDYPYYSIQYRVNGTPVSVIYFVSKDCQYLYNPDGTFEGVWFKQNLFNKKNKIILTRTAY